MCFYYYCVLDVVVGSNISVEEEEYRIGKRWSSDAKPIVTSLGLYHLHFCLFNSRHHVEYVLELSRFLWLNFTTYMLISDQFRNHQNWNCISSNMTIRFKVSIVEICQYKGSCILKLYFCPKFSNGLNWNFNNFNKGLARFWALYQTYDVRCAMNNDDLHQWFERQPMRFSATEITEWRNSSS